MAKFTKLPTELLLMIHNCIDGIKDAPQKQCEKCLTGINYLSSVSTLARLNRRCHSIFSPILFDCCGSIYAIRWAVQNRNVEVLKATLRHATTPEIRRELVNREAYIHLEPEAYRHPVRERALTRPLELACSRGYDEIVSLLLEAGADTTASTTRSTPRHWYCGCMAENLWGGDCRTMNPLRRAICGEHSSTALLLLQQNAAFPDILTTPNSTTLGALCSAIAHGDVAVVDYLLRRLQKLRVEDPLVENNFEYRVERSFESRLASCGNYNAVSAIAGLISRYHVASGAWSEADPDDFNNAALDAIDQGNWVGALALFEASRVPMSESVAQDGLEHLMEYWSWTRQYWEFWPHYFGEGYVREWDDHIRDPSFGPTWMAQPQDVGVWHMRRTELFEKLVKARVPRPPWAYIPIELSSERIPLHELENLLALDGIIIPENCYDVETVGPLEWAIADEDVTTLKALLQARLKLEFVALDPYVLRYQYALNRPELKGDIRLQDITLKLEILTLLLESGLQESGQPRHWHVDRFDFTGCHMPRCSSLLCLTVGRLGSAAISLEMRDYFQRVFDLLMEKLTHASITEESWRHATAVALNNPCSLSGEICRALGKLAARLGFASNDTSAAPCVLAVVRPDGLTKTTITPAYDEASGLCRIHSTLSHGNKSQVEALLSLAEGYGRGIPTTAGIIPSSALLLVALQSGKTIMFPERLRAFAGRVKDLGSGTVPALGHKRLLHIVAYCMPYCTPDLWSELLSLSDDWDFNVVDSFPDNTPFMLLCRSQTPETIGAIALAISHGADPYLSTRSQEVGWRGGKTWDMLQSCDVFEGMFDDSRPRMATLKALLDHQTLLPVTGDSAFEQAIIFGHDQIVKEILANTPPSSKKDAAIMSFLEQMRSHKYDPSMRCTLSSNFKFHSEYRKRLHIEALAVRSIGKEKPSHLLLLKIFGDVVARFWSCPSLVPARQHRSEHLLGILTEVILLGADVNKVEPQPGSLSFAVHLHNFMHEIPEYLASLRRHYQETFSLHGPEFDRVLNWRFSQLAISLRLTFRVVTAETPKGMDTASRTWKVTCHPEEVISPTAFLESQLKPDSEVEICNALYPGVRLDGWTRSRYLTAQRLSRADDEVRGKAKWPPKGPRGVEFMNCL
ncbi:hypothetical protein B0T21DRAFT_35007 [Apiosordaria backusii]|uniref:Ankyrin n=1 Tax=Apiosordaria backusii TaxID=314023 RepID=A0AA40B2I8_9PEZI|nr:hypothetical protein B0T21DRAFT_35007 [Apiosordaria backusii]